MGNCGFAIMGLIATVLLDKLIIRLYIAIQCIQICLLGLPVVFLGIYVFVGLFILLNPHYFSFYYIVLEVAGISSLAIFFLSVRFVSSICYLFNIIN